MTIFVTHRSLANEAKTAGQIGLLPEGDDNGHAAMGRLSLARAKALRVYRT
jgi:hypothetical protein